MSDARSPVLPAWGHDHRWCWRIDDAAALAISTRKYIEEGHWSKFRLIDSSLRKFMVSDVKVLGRAGLFGWRPGYSGLYLRIRLEYQASQISLDEAKEDMTSFLRQHPDVYGAGGESREFLSAIAAARSPSELIAALP